MKAAILATTLANLATACLKTKLDITNSVGTYVAVSTYDNGVTTCNGADAGLGESGSIDCIDGYSLDFDFGAPGDNNGMSIHYGTPHGPYFYTLHDPDCSYHPGCLGRTNPVVCSECSFYGEDFGC